MARPRIGYHVDGEPIPGVTTICGMLNKPALVGWAGKLCTESAWRIGRAGEPLPKWSELLYGVRDDAASAGTLVHELFEAHIRKIELPVVPDTDVGRAATQGFTNAKLWLESSGLEIESHERPLVSTEYRYGGTPDAICTDGRNLYLADWKTSAAIYAEMVIQMAAYRHLLLECERTVVEGVHLVRFSRDHGDFAHHFFSNDLLDQGWRVFSALLLIAPVLKSIEKRVK